ISFPAQFLPCDAGPATPAGTATAGGIGATQAPCYVGADPNAEQAAFRALMTPTVSKPPTPATTSRAPGRSGLSGAQRPPSDVTPDAADGKAQAAALRRAGMPVYYPGVITPAAQ